jgi:hypothetical protein
MGHPQPAITSIADVPADEGGWVRITLRPGDGQDPGEEYEIHDAQYPGDVVHVGTWTGSPSYTVDVLTWGIGVPNDYSVTTATDGFGMTSAVVSGTSLDNLAPPPPVLTGYRSGAHSVELSWNVPAPDVAFYVIGRTDLGVLDSVTTTTLTDLTAPASAVGYRMNAVDVHGNQSPNSNGLNIPDATGVPDVAAGPRVLTLLPGSPNPFREITTFRLGIPAAARAQVEVYDLAGRRVASRDLGVLAAGWRDVTVAARDGAGRPLASGVYFCRVAAGGESSTHKITIRR